MKKSVLVFVLIGAFFACQQEQADHELETTWPQQPFMPIEKGTNISHWLSQSKARGAKRQAFFTEEDVKYIASLGFDHFRLPIDEEQMWTEEGDKDPEAFQLMHNAIRWAQQAELKVIIDLHILRSHHFNEASKPLWTEPAAQEQFINNWRELSAELKGYPNGLVAYELMNEPVADDPEDWNRLLARAAAAVREVEPERLLVIGSNRWQSVNTFDQLKVPANDQNILLSFHFYEPFLLSHYQASWTFLKNYEGEVHYPGAIATAEDLDQASAEIRTQIQADTFNLAKLESMLAKPLQKAKETGLPLYCGEWGVITNTPQEDRLRWYDDMQQIFEKNGIAYTNWDYKSSNFGLIRESGEKDDALIQIVTRDKSQ